jgi:hypothetical protein
MTGYTIPYTYEPIYCPYVNINKQWLFVTEDGVKGPYERKDDALKAMYEILSSPRPAGPRT